MPYREKNANNAKPRPIYNRWQIGLYTSIGAIGLGGLLLAMLPVVAGVAMPLVVAGTIGFAAISTRAIYRSWRARRVAKENAALLAAALDKNEKKSTPPHSSEKDILSHLGDHDLKGKVDPTKEAELNLLLGINKESPSVEQQSLPQSQNEKNKKDEDEGEGDSHHFRPR